MIELLDREEAQALFMSLPHKDHVATLSPAYVGTDATHNADLKPLYLCYRTDNRFWLHGVHRGKVPETNWFDLQSPYGYGGPIANSEDAAFLSNAWNEYTDWCVKNDILAEFVRFHPLVENSRFYCGNVRDDRQTVAVDLRVPSLLASYATRCRTAVRKAVATGCEAIWYRPEQAMERFHTFYRNAMERIGADRFYFFNDAYFEALAQFPGLRLLASERNGEWNAAAIFLDSDMVSEYHLSATSPEGRTLGATNFLLHAAAENAQERGLHWLHLGGGTDSMVDNRLLFFKQGFSQVQLTFRIGYTIHCADDYDALRRRSERSSVSENRVLFYR